MGPKNQPEYVNAAAAIETSLPPGDLLLHLHALEQAHGRIRDTARWGPRTLDLDILLYGRCRYSAPGIVLPHPGAHRRCFVLRPMADLEADLGREIEIPGRGTVAELLSHCDCTGVARLDVQERMPPG